MDQSNILNRPAIYTRLEERCEAIGFTMPSDIYIGTLLKSLIASKPKSNILELGTGISLSLAWMVEGLDEHSKIISIDNDPALIQIAKEFFGGDQRVNLICADGSDWIKENSNARFDLIFADAWPGKFFDLPETLDLLKVGGFYVIDDLSPTDNWPKDHADKVKNLIALLESREDLTICKMDWSTGVIICTKK